MSLKTKGGLNVVSLAIWNKACILKLLWNLCRKFDSLWIRWVHTYYVKTDQMMNVPTKLSCSWILWEILKTRLVANGWNHWQHLVNQGKFKTKKIYTETESAMEEVDV